MAALLGEMKQRGASVDAVGFDTDRTSLLFSRERLSAAFPGARLDLREQNFLDFGLCGPTQSSLFGSVPNSLGSFDLVIANPPYVRTQVLGAAKSQALARAFELSGRVDLYHAFVKAIAHVLRPGGIAGIIVSNRFMTTKAGASTRAGIAEHFDILHVWDLGDTRIFEAAVLPAVLLLKRKGADRKRTSLFTAVYRHQTEGEAETATDAIDALRLKGLVRTDSGETLEVRHGILDCGPAPGDIWRLSTPAVDDWLKTVSSNTYCTFGEVGKVRVGVKTTADSVFIRTDWSSIPEDQRPELLRPLTTHHIARRYRAVEAIPERQILYPHESENGMRSPVDIRLFPKTRRYLEAHRQSLEGRKYVSEAGRRWYEIWVPQDPAAWGNPKVVFRDIAELPTFWMDLGGTVVNGDCYWIDSDNARGDGFDEILWLLLAVANSRFIETFYDHMFHNKLYSGRRRFMTQYVEAFPLPDPAAEKSRRLVELAQSLYSNPTVAGAKNLEQEVDVLVHESFGVEPALSPRGNRPEAVSGAFC